MNYNKKDYSTWDKAQKEKFIKIAKEHQEADRFIQGNWISEEKKNGKFRGCFYGCMTQTKNNTLDEAIRVMNLPAWIIHISERIFEGLPEEEAIKFPLQLLEAIPTDIDTYQMWKDWSYTLLMDEEHGIIKYCGDNQQYIDAVKQVAELFNGEYTIEDAESAAKSAVWSTEFAAWSAEFAANYAKYAEYNHYLWLRDTLFNLLKNNYEK